MTLLFREPVAIDERAICIPNGEDDLTGSLSLVERPAAVILVANDRGCSRHDPAQHALLAGLRRSGFATVLVDLLLPAEAASPELAAWARLQTVELARRIASARAFIEQRRELSRLPLVLFGQGAGAGAALLSAGARPRGVAAVIAQGLLERSKMALEAVRAPVFLSSEASPEACARAASSWIRSRIAPRQVASTWV
jgi:putative phosphoribosyl transferase